MSPQSPVALELQRAESWAGGDHLSPGLQERCVPRHIFEALNVWLTDQCASSDVRTSLPVVPSPFVRSAPDPPLPQSPWMLRLRSAISATLPQPPACTIHVGTHHERSATTGKKSAGAALAGTHNLADTDPRAGTGPFLNRVPLFFLWSTLVNPNQKGTMVLTQLTAISCIINFVFPSFNGIQAWRAEILPGSQET